MANPIRRGFVPWGSKSGGKGVIPSPNRYEVASGYGTAIFAGDVIALDADGTAKAAAAGDTNIIGICREVSYVTGGVRVWDTYLPASTTYTPTARHSAAASYVDVWDSPDTIYSVTIAASAVANHDTWAEIFEFQGNNMDHVATAGSTTYKASRHELGGTIVEAGTAGFRIIGPDEEIGLDPTIANARFLVMINELLHPFISTTGDAS